MDGGGMESAARRTGELECDGGMDCGCGFKADEACSFCCALVAFERVEEEAVVRHAVPVEDLLLFLRADAVVLVEEVEEGALGLLERGIGAGLEIAQVGEDAFLEFLRVLDRPAEGLETKGETPDDVGARDMEQITPARGGQQAWDGNGTSSSPTVTYQSTHDTYSPVGSRKRRMYWSGDQSTGAEMRKYLTVMRPTSVLAKSCGHGAWWCEGEGRRTYGCPPAAMRRSSPGSNSAEHPAPARTSQAQRCGAAAAAVVAAEPAATSANADATET
nr:hypothetical protein CFP56_33722 [Quercus suber]